MFTATPSAAAMVPTPMFQTNFATPSISPSSILLRLDEITEDIVLILSDFTLREKDEEDLMASISKSGK